MFPFLYVLFFCLFVILLAMLLKSNAQIKKLDNALSELNNNAKAEKEALNNKLRESTAALNTVEVQLETTRKEKAQFKAQLEHFTKIDEDSEHLNIVNGIYEESTDYDSVISEDAPPLSADQRKALDIMLHSGRNLFITGKAGSGKSFLLKRYIKEVHKLNLPLRNKDRKHILITAPTGIAALNIGASTIHSVFGFDNLESDIVETAPEKLKFTDESKKIIQYVDTLVIDEVSMVRCDVFDRIERILRYVRNNEAPFGGVQIILFGDVFQLPPVSKKEETIFLKKKYGGIYFFHSEAYKNNDFGFIELTSNHRQKGDTRYYEILNRMRDGKLTQDDVDLLNTRVVSENSPELRRVPHLYPTRLKTKEKNSSELDLINAKLHKFKTEIIWDEQTEQSDKIKNGAYYTETLELKMGSLVMMTHNDPQKNWVNGHLAIVSGFSYNPDTQEEHIWIKMNKTEYEVSRHEISVKKPILEDDTIKYKTILTTAQFPMILGYAITIHKSQGQTFQKIACNLNNSFAPGQAYVALSRCTSLDGLYLLCPVSASQAFVNHEALSFYNISKASNMIM